MRCYFHFLLALRVCGVCKGKGGVIEGLVCLLFYKLGLYVGFLWGCALLIVASRPHLLSQCCIALEVQAPLNLVLVDCHRFKRTHADLLCLPNILIFEYALSWPACTDKPPEPGVEPKPPEPGSHTGHMHCSKWLMLLRHQGRPRGRQNHIIFEEMLCQDAD